MNDTTSVYSLFRRCFPSYPIEEETLSGVLGLSEATILRRFRGERCIGCAVLWENSVSLLMVAPEEQGRGVGSSLLLEAEQRIRESGADTAVLGAGSRYLFQGVPLDLPYMPGFFEKRGFRAEWNSVNMRLPLKEFSMERQKLPPVSGEIEFRFAAPSEQEALLTAVEATEPSWLTFFADSLSDVWVAVLPEGIAGFVITETEGGRFPVPGVRVGSIGCVGVVPWARERGIGRRLVASAAEWLKRQGCDYAEALYIELEEWYRAIGFETVSRQWMGEKKL